MGVNLSNHGKAPYFYGLVNECHSTLDKFSIFIVTNRLFLGNILIKRVFVY